MNATEDRADAFEDMAIEVPEPSSEREVWPAGIYNARLVGLKTVPKPDWMIATGEDEDREQWRWTYEILDGEYRGERIAAYTNRSWNEKANAHKAAAALLGVPTLPVGVGMSTGQLAGKTCQLWVSERTSKQDATKQYNKVDKVTHTPAKRHREAAVKPPVGRVQLDNFPQDLPPEAEGDDLEF